jgi:cytochrome d ubiquinol oxidase subunit I
MLALTSLDAARAQMAVSLGFHIVFAAIGIGLPPLILFAEYRAIRTGDAVWMSLARRWAYAMGILVAVGAVSGTVLSFALGLFWPGLMGRWGSVIGLPFALEAFAFFIEAIFVGIYLYGWDRLSPWGHWFSGWPVALGGLASAWFVVTANSWMQSPAGFRLSAGGQVIDVQPIRAMLNPSTPIMTTHMILAAYMATGLTVASIYAVGMIRGRRDAYHRRALALGLTLGLVIAPFQVVVGDAAARLVAERQPAKLAAIEALWHTTAGAPLTIGGIPLTSREETILGIRIPKGLSWLPRATRTP